MKNARKVVAVGCSVLAAVAFSTGAQGEDTPPELVSASVAEAPTLDGDASDEAWKAAIPLEVTAKRPLAPNKGASVSVTIRSVYRSLIDPYAGGDVYFLVTWEDSTESVSH